jgi:raffinose/stachyose/melibiose transport system permease protein
MRRRVTVSGVLMGLFVVVWLFITVFPLYFTLISSLKTDKQIFANYFAPPTAFHFENYAMAQQMSNILRALANSVGVSLAAIVILLFIDVLAAYIIARRKVPFSGVWMVLLSAAIMIPLQSILIPIVQLVAKLNAYNDLGMMTLVYVAVNMSFGFFVLYGSVLGVSKEIDESAEVDGCNLIRLVVRIIAPMIKPAIATCAIVSFLFIYNELALANVLMSKKDLRMISVALLNFKGDFGVYYAYTFAAIIIAIIPTLAFYLLAQENVEKGLTAGAVKG